MLVSIVLQDLGIYTKGLDIRGNIYRKRSLDCALSLNNLALIYYKMGVLNETVDIFSEALEIKKEVLPEIYVAEIYERHNMLEEAEVYRTLCSDNT